MRNFAVESIGTTGMYSTMLASQSWLEKHILEMGQTERSRCPWLKTSSRKDICIVTGLDYCCFRIGIMATHPKGGKQWNGPYAPVARRLS